LDGYGADNAAAIVNDANGATRRSGCVNNVRFKHYRDRMFIVAMTVIHHGQELYVAYGHKYWKMTPEQYNVTNIDNNNDTTNNTTNTPSTSTSSSSTPSASV
jgi:hypothetical protein